MNIVLDQPSPTDASIKITLYEEDYQPQVEKKIKSYSKQMNLKGFRPGKVPPAIVKKMYGKTILAEEINAVLSESIHTYVQENDLNVVGDPIPQLNDEEAIDWGNQKEYTFQYKLGVVPPFEINPSDLQVTRYKVDYTDDELQELIKDLRQRNGETSPAENSEEGDFMFGDLKPLLSEEPSEEEAQTEEENTFPLSVLLPYNQLSDSVASEFLGKKFGDVVQFNIQELFANGARGISLATGLSEEEAAQLQGDFTFTFERITRTELAEMNEDFYQKVLGEEVKDQEAFQERVRELVKENFERDAEQYMMAQIRKSFGDKVEMELPESFLKEWLLLSNEGVTAEQIEEEFDGFRDNLKWNLIQQKVVKEQSLGATKEEIEARARGMIASQFGGQLPMGPEFESHMDSLVKTFLEAQDGRNMQHVVGQVLDDKVLFYLREQVEVVEAETTRDEFEKLIQPQ